MWCTFLLSPWQQLFRKCSWCVKLCQITVVCFPHDIALRCDLKYLKLKCTFISTFGNFYIFLLWHVLSSSKINAFKTVADIAYAIMCRRYNKVTAISISTCFMCKYQLSNLWCITSFYCNSCAYTFILPLCIESLTRIYIYTTSVHWVFDTHIHLCRLCTLSL